MAAGAAELEPGLTAAGPLFFIRRTLLDLKRGLTVDMTRDSLLLLAGRFGAVCRSSLAFNGQRDEACLKERFAGRNGTGDAMSPRLAEFIRGEGPTPAALTALETSLASLCKNRTRVRLYINPTHALTLDALYWSGKWTAMEDWQRSLVALGERRRRAGCDLRLVDFSGYNSITSEAVPQVSRRKEMQHYWEASHYRVDVGGMILARLFGGAGQIVPDDFGVELDGASLAAHLAAMRAARERYHLEHPQETAFVRAIAASVAASRPSLPSSLAAAPPPFAAAPPPLAAAPLSASAQP
jgi:hypothetical protein